MAKNDTENTPNEREETVIVIPEELETSFRPELCIYKVPLTIRRVNAAAYTPQLVSIGPIHHGKWPLTNMDIQKFRYFKEFCGRFDKMTQNEVKGNLWSVIAKHEDSIRHCYEETSKFESNDFIKMILLDAIFIVELLLRDDKEWDYENDFIIGQPSQREVVELDLLLLENQLPYFVLTELYGFYLSNSHQDKPQSNPEDNPGDKFQDNSNPLSFHQLVCRYCGFPESARTLSWAPNHTKHLLDLARYMALQESSLETKPSHRPVKLKYTATKLHQAGVEFGAAKGIDSMLGIKFEKGVLTVPILEFDHTSETDFRNIMAFEQCHYPFDTYVCNHFFVMDHLINTAEDVDLLVDAGIIVNWLGSNQMVADLINRLCQGIGEYASCYSDMCGRLNAHYNNRWNRRKAILKLVYFSNLWRGTGTVAAATLLIMTLVQTITSIKSLF